MLPWILALSLIALADPVIVLEGPASVEFSDAAGVRTARLAVKPVTAKVTDADAPQVVEFALGDLRVDQPPSPLTASWQVLKDNSPAALVLTLSEKVRRPGVYRAVIAPLPASQPAERLTLQITIRAAKLKLPDKLIIARTIFLPLPSSDVAPALTVQEQTGLARVSALQVKRLSAMSGTLPIAAGVKPTTDPVTIEAGKSAPVPYTIDGALPVGVVGGKLWMNATELAEPVELDYEIRSRLTSWYIPVVIGLGFLLGYLIRVRLANIIALSAAREQANDLLTQVEASLAERPDATFRAAFATEKTALDTALASGKPAKITAAVTALDAKWRPAMAEFAQRKTATTGALEELRDLAGPPLPLPPASAVALRAASDAVITAASALQRGDVATAQQTIERARAILDSALRTAAVAWQDALVALLARIENAQQGLPAAVTSEFAERRKAMHAFDQIVDAQPSATPEARRALLITWHGEYREARNLLQELDARFGTEWGLVNREVSSVKAKLGVALDDLAAAVVDLRARFSAAADDPAALRDDLGNRLQKLDNRWRAALVDPAPADKRDALKDTLRARQFVKLAREVTDTLVDKLLSGSGAEPALPAGSWLQLPAATALLVPPRAEQTPAQVVVTRPVTPRLTGGAARGLQSVLLAALYILVYAMIAHESFGQSWTEPATLLVSSFMIDLTADGLLGALLKIKGVTG